MDRVIGLIDMDCFYAQVEQREQPELWDSPVVVVQHAREGAPGGVIAVSYEARKFGVKRGMMIPEAKTKCPDLNICFVPQGEHIDKADIQKYRDASVEVFDVLNAFDERIVVERASVDEAFLDLTEFVDQRLIECGAAEMLQELTGNISTLLPTTHLADGCDKEDEEAYNREGSLRNWLEIKCAKELSHLRLAIAAQTIERMRANIREHTQFFCSGGIANNKMLAKLVCARHKPRQQTVLPFEFVPIVFEDTSIGDVRMLGGKLGHALQERFAIGTMAQLATIPFEMIEQYFGSQAQWIHQLAKGFDDEPVKPRDSQQSIAVSKNFPGKNALATVPEVRRWIEGLSKELSKRLVADQVKISSYNPQVLADVMWSAAKNFNRAPLGSDKWDPPVFNLYMSASRFVSGVSAQNQSIMEWVEKRLKPGGAGSSMLESTDQSAPDPRVFVKGVLKPSSHLEVPGPSGGTISESDSPIKTTATVKSAGAEPEVDEDGWQVYNPRAFEAPSEAVPALELNDIGVISPSVFQELPENIKAELAHFHKLDQAKKLKAAAEERGNNKPQGKKRPVKLETKEPPPKKKLDAFFKKE
nr:DNA-repair protein domain containing protein [Haemonchus contortus]